MSAGLFADPAYDAGLERLAEMQRAKARAYALEMRTLTALAFGKEWGWRSDAPRDSLVLDIAGTCEIGQMTASSRLDEAEHLVERLPGTLALLESGELLLPAAQVMVRETRDLSAEVCARVEERVLPTAAGRAPARLREKVRRAVQAVDAEQAAARSSRARTDRRVWTSPAPNGMAFIGALAPAADAARLMGTLTTRARELAAAGDERTMDQLRADLLCGWDGAAALDSDGRRVRPVQVVVHVPVATALGLSDEPGRLEGYGPLEAGTTRRLLAEAELRKACVDSRTGRVVAVEDTVVRPAKSASALRTALVDMVLTETVWSDDPEPQHDPSASLSRLVRTRDQGCDGPGCGTGAGRCELDHHHAWPEGPTMASNLAARSPRCHHAKHTGWTVTTHGDGSSTWINSGGRSYLVLSRDEPPPGIPPDTALPELPDDTDAAPPWLTAAPEQDQPDG